MDNRIAKTVSLLTRLWENLTIESILKSKLSMQKLAQDPVALNHRKSKFPDSPFSLQLYQDKKNEFILLFFSELQGTYRNPHDHGDAWVIHTVASGQWKWVIILGPLSQMDSPILS